MSNFYETQDKLTAADIKNIAYMDGPTIEQIDAMNFNKDDLIALAMQCIEWSNKHPNVELQYITRANNIVQLLKEK